MTSIFPTTAEISHLGDYAYRAIKTIAEENGSFAKLDGFQSKEEFYEKLKNLISQFKKPVLLTNITMNVVFDTFFRKSKDEKECFTYKLDDTDTFNIHCNPYLAGMHDDFVIFSEESFDNATIVKFNLTDLF